MIRRGAKAGTVIAHANSCFSTPGVTDVHLMNPLSTIELEHIVHSDSSKTQFIARGKVYYWKGHTELFEEYPDAEIAKFYPSWSVIDVNEHKLGKLVIQASEENLIDLAVITALVVQERADEGRQAV